MENKSFLIRMPPTLHRLIKTEAAQNGQTVSQIVCDAVIAWLSQEKEETVTLEEMERKLYERTR